MKAKRKFVDILLILGMLLPFLLCMLLKVLTAVPSDGISVTGAQIYFTIPMPIQDLPVTEAQVVSLAVLCFLFFLCLFLTRNLQMRPTGVRQLIAEYIVEATEKLVRTNMGDFFLNAGFAPFIAAILGISVFSSFSSLLGLFPPTSDINVIAGWSILVFLLITAYKLKGGAWNYVKGYFEPIPVFAPLNLLGEVATPISMSFRHYGNVLSGVCISALLSYALGGLTNAVFSFLPAGVNMPPILRIGIPAVFSVYFDVFSGALQAFIFSMLTMLNISGGFPMELYEKRKAKRNAKKEKKDGAAGPSRSDPAKAGA